MSHVTRLFAVGPSLFAAIAIIGCASETSDDASSSSNESLSKANPCPSRPQTPPTGTAPPSFVYKYVGPTLAPRSEHIEIQFRTSIPLGQSKSYTSLESANATDASIAVIGAGGPFSGYPLPLKEFRIHTNAFASVSVPGIDAWFLAGNTDSRSGTTPAMVGGLTSGISWNTKSSTFPGIQLDVSYDQAHQSSAHPSCSGINGCVYNSDGQGSVESYGGISPSSGTSANWTVTGGAAVTPPVVTPPPNADTPFTTCDGSPRFPTTGPLRFSSGRQETFGRTCDAFGACTPWRSETVVPFASIDPGSSLDPAGNVNAVYYYNHTYDRLNGSVALGSGGGAGQLNPNNDNTAVALRFGATCLSITDTSPRPIANYGKQTRRVSILTM